MRAEVARSNLPRIGRGRQRERRGGSPKKRRLTRRRCGRPAGR
jgi:hypothetical protein